MTRTKTKLLALLELERLWRRDQMLQRPVIRIEQVPLRSISKIVKEEMQRKKAAEKAETDSRSEPASSGSNKERP
jgi:hypothetical protein